MTRYPTAHAQSTIWILIAAMFSFLALSALIASYVVNHDDVAPTQSKPAESPPCK